MEQGTHLRPKATAGKALRSAWRLVRQIQPRQPQMNFDCLDGFSAPITDDFCPPHGGKSMVRQNGGFIEQGSLRLQIARSYDRVAAGTWI
ncbi:hypothetical protein QO021_31560 (plasmid) [Pseudomonas amygdali pv. lachrymans]|uniref:hypothetical protein n=2 Tax=Pseudomonas amygdali TaxID=47877 RepID=UPI0019111AC0|nr:hypothetical protein [Pseudomonas amygdali]WIO61849.1 hypothetical protein QO021_31560 [Pseudomonas amygdali pv. lachrymans]